MAFLQSGGGVVGSAQITDGAIVNADVNAAAAIVQSKIAGTANGNTDIIAAESSYATTHSLTTVAGQRVVVIASVRPDGAAGLVTVSLQYNGVTKHSTVVGSNSDGQMVTLMYTEVPGAATANITLTTTAGTLDEPCIMVIKMK